MSLSDERLTTDPARTGRAGRGVALVAMAAVAALAAGCSDGSGFQPLYATNAITGTSAGQRLAQVEISPIPGRVGQRVRNELVFQSTGGGAALPPVYRLEVAIRETLQSTLVTRTGDSASQIYNLDANFRLVRLSDKKVVFEGTSSGRAGFERYTSIFSNVRAREDAENRAARVVSQDMKVRLSAFLATAT